MALCFEDVNSHTLYARITSLSQRYCMNDQCTGALVALPQVI